MAFMSITMIEARASCIIIIIIIIIIIEALASFLLLWRLKPHEIIGSSNTH
jgi:hypothetical protein